MLFAAKCSAMLTVLHRKMYWRTHGSSAAARIRCGGQGTEAQRQFRCGGQGTEAAARDMSSPTLFTAGAALL